MCVPASAKPAQHEMSWGGGIAASALVVAAVFFAARHWPGLVAAIASNPTSAAAIAIFAATYIVIAIGKLPGFYLDRAGAALLGRQPDGRNGGAVARPGAALDRLRHDRIAARHDDRRRQSAPLRLLPPGDQLGRDPRPPSAAAAGRGNNHVGIFLGFSGQRHNMPGVDPGRARSRLAPAPQPGALSAGGGNGIERRQRGDDHRQPAEHHDRQLLADPLWRFRRLAVAGRCDRAACDLCFDRAVSSGRVLDTRAAAGSAGAGARLPAARNQSGGGDLGDDGRFLCRSARQPSWL